MRLPRLIICQDNNKRQQQQHKLCCITKLPLYGLLKKDQKKFMFVCQAQNLQGVSPGRDNIWVLFCSMGAGYTVLYLAHSLAY